MRSRTSVGARGRRVGAQTKRGDVASAAPSAPASRPAGAARAALVMPRSRGFASGRRRGCASPSFRNSGVALMAASAAAWLATRAIDAATLRALEGHLVEATRERFLEDVLRRVAVADPPLEEREKRAPVLDEHRSYLASWRELGNFAGGLASPLLHSVLQTQRTRIVRAARKCDHADVRANGYTCSQEELA